MGMFKEVAEVVFAHGLFQTLRSNHVFLDAIAEHVAREEGQSGIVLGVPGCWLQKLLSIFNPCNQLSVVSRIV